MQVPTQVLADKKLLVGMTGSIAVAGLPPYLAMFRSYFDQVRVIMTYSAEQMIPPFTVSLFADEVYAPSMGKEPISHVELARWSDLFIILPATANVIGLVANGLATNLLTSTALASPQPLILYPNMNLLMWDKKAVQRNVQTIEEDGHTIIQPIRTNAYEIASRSVRPNLLLPPSDQVLRDLIQVAQTRGKLVEPAQSATKSPSNPSIHSA
ncbi:Flavoprotein [Marininema mesophilum]|uniref:Flavoprotein n=1 Tax=Marininema mesophilum TaxID=1048340 RepID=A0A1H2WKI0_9BACL|nr:phosphopantothenate--cysteine ligase family flavoprotein [Marininema mesophilum]SDW81037.1 Flavoprotein [Marininema mesophilum]